MDLTEILRSQCALFESGIIHAEANSKNLYLRNSASGFLHIFPYDMYKQKYLEPYIESLVRNHLLNGVFQQLFMLHGSEFTCPPLSEQLNVKPLLISEFEKITDFEFILKGEKNVGIRYTDFEDCFNPVIHEDVDCILILSLREPDNVEGEYYITDTTDDGKTIIWYCLKSFFQEYFSEEEYFQYRAFINKELELLQNFIGIKTLPKLSPQYLFGFRIAVNSTVRNDVHELLGYQPIEEYNIKKYPNIQRESYQMLYDSGIITNYLDNSLYRYLFGKTDCAISLYTSEYLRQQFPSDELFDYTSIVSGYLKSIEQLMLLIALLSSDAKLKIKKNSQQYATVVLNDFTAQYVANTTLGSLKNYFNEHKELLLNITDPTQISTFFNCITLFTQECRNHIFHKKNIDDWSIVEKVRKNTFLLYVMLLGGCKLGKTIEINEKRFCTIDDRIEQLSLYLTEWEIKDFYIQYGASTPQHIYNTTPNTFPEYDKYGYCKSNSISFLSRDSKSIVLITRDNFPTKIWYFDRTKQKHFIDFL